MTTGWVDEHVQRVQRARLAAGCCPVHGIDMPQIGVEYDDGGEPVGPIVACPRKDCTFEHVVFGREVGHEVGHEARR